MSNITQQIAIQDVSDRFVMKHHLASADGEKIQIDINTSITGASAIIDITHLPTGKTKSYSIDLFGIAKKLANQITEKPQSD